MTSPIELVCCDLAGTTVSDAGAVEDAFTAAMSAEGVLPGGDRFDSAMTYVRETMGQSKIVVFTELFDGDVATAERANHAFEKFYGQSVDEGRIAPLPGAEAAIRAVLDLGVKVCLTTGFSATTRRSITDGLGWTDLVDLCLSPEDVGRGRPWPDMILAAVIRLEISAVDCVAVVGDTSNDLWAGHRAGARLVVGVLTGAHGKEVLTEAPHTHLIESIADLPSLIAGQ